MPKNIEQLKRQLLKRGTETEETLSTRLTNAQSEIQDLLTEKRIFNYRIVNDNLDVSKSIMGLLTQGLYPEELLGENTDELIASTPRFIKPEAQSRGGMGKTLMTLAVMTGAIAATAYLY